MLGSALELGSAMKTVLDWSERLLVVALFALFALANYRSHDVSNWLLIVLEAVSVGFVLTRRKAISVSEAPADWALAIGATCFTLLLRPGGEPLIHVLPPLLITLGGLIAASAKMSLNRRFGIAPANRGVQSAWAYSLVRHPMYLGYVVAHIGYVLHNPTSQNVLVILTTWVLLVLRIHREERLLMEDGDYRAYASKVRNRLIPGLY